MGFLRYGDVEYEANDDVLATLRIAHAVAVRAGASFSVNLFDNPTQSNVELLLGPGIPFTTRISGGDANLETAMRWSDRALAGESIAITCLDVVCDCVLRDNA